MPLLKKTKKKPLLSEDFTSSVVKSGLGLLSPFLIPAARSAQTLNQTSQENIGELASGVVDMTPLGDVRQIYQGLLDKDNLGIGLGLASLAFPGTITNFNQFKNTKKLLEKADDLKKEEALLNLRRQVTEELTPIHIKQEYSKLELTPTHNIGDRFIASNGARLEVSSLEFPEGGIPSYRVKQIFPDGRITETRLSDKNLEFTQKLGITE